MSELSIKVNIGGRTYPLTVNRDEEEIIRKAAKRVNDHLDKYKQNYSVSDKQDLLAMTSLQLATILLRTKPEPIDDKLLNELQSIDELLSNNLA
jgi:cell division protein ZapA (FtsZ GTPase activity inhibitor)